MNRILVAVLALALVGCATVGTGYRGVKLHFSKPTGEVLGEGFYVYNPLAGSGIIPMNVQTVADQAKTNAHTSDLQQVDTTVTVNYHLDPGKIADIYERLGTDAQTRIIEPTIREAVTAALAKQKANQLIDRRTEVSDYIDSHLRQRLAQYGIATDQVLITDISFNDAFQQSVEARMSAQQELLTAQIDAQKAVAQAKGAAASQEAQRVTLSPLVLQKMAIEKWDGHFPSYLTTAGGANNINLFKMLGGSNE